LLSAALLVAVHFVIRLRPRRGWVSTGGGSIGVEDLSRLAAGARRGLIRLGDDSNDENIRLTIGVATSEVAAIRLSTAERNWTRPVGVDGFFLLGVIPREPPTRAIAIGHDGGEIDGPSILL
jgi:hypothetical protein